MLDMTADELYELVRDWPDGARPPCIEYISEIRGQGWFDDDSYVAVSLAVLAHVASAVEWLVDGGHTAVPYKSRGGLYGIADGKTGHTGPTLLHAIDAAVRAVGGGG